MWRRGQEEKDGKGKDFGEDGDWNEREGKRKQKREIGQCLKGGVYSM